MVKFYPNPKITNPAYLDLILVCGVLSGTWIAQGYFPFQFQSIYQTVEELSLLHPELILEYKTKFGENFPILLVIGERLGIGITVLLLTRFLVVFILDSIRTPITIRKFVTYNMLGFICGTLIPNLWYLKNFLFFDTIHFRN